MEFFLSRLNILTADLVFTPAMSATIKNYKLYEVSVSLSPRALKKEIRSQIQKYI